MKNTQTVLNTVFLYRVNVAIAAFLIFVNAQFFINALMSQDEYMPQNAPAISGALLAVCIIYGFIAFNFMMAKITIFPDALEYRSIFSRRYFAVTSIKSASFSRKDHVRLKITLHPHKGKPFTIPTTRFKNPQPLIDFAAQFPKS